MFPQMQRYGNGKMLRLEVAGRRPGGRANRRFMHVVKEDMELAGAREDDAEEVVKRRQLIGCGHR